MKTIRQIIEKSILGVAVVTVFLFTSSCTQESIAYDNEELVGIEAKGGKAATRPIRITLEGIDNFDSPGGTFTGKMTHLGKVYGTVAPSDFTFTDVGFDVLTIEGDKDVIYAANGDELHSLSDISFVGPISETEFGPFTYSGTITFVGGTGRFEEASGSMLIENGVLVTIGVKADGSPRTEYSHVGNGEITY